MRECVRVRARMHACVHDVFAIYDNNILPRRIMIMIKIIFLYFIEIAHSDDFPSTGTRLRSVEKLVLSSDGYVSEHCVKLAVNQTVHQFTVIVHYRRTYYIQIR